MHRLGSEVALEGVREPARPQAHDPLVRTEAGAVRDAAGSALSGVPNRGPDDRQAGPDAPRTAQSQAVGQAGGPAGAQRSPLAPGQVIAPRPSLRNKGGRPRKNAPREPEPADLGAPSPLLDLKRLLSGGPLVFYRTSKVTKETQVVIVDESPRSWCSFPIYPVIDPKANVLMPKGEPMGVMLYSDLRRMLEVRTWRTEEKKIKTVSKAGVESVRVTKTAVFNSNGAGETRDAVYIQIDKKAYGRRLTLVKE